MSTHTSTKKGRDFRRVVTEEHESLVRFAELLKLRSLSLSTQAEYMRYVRKLGRRMKCDPAGLEESQVRAHLLHLKEAHHYSPSSMRTAVSAMRGFYGRLLGHDWKLFDLVRSPEAWWTFNAARFVLPRSDDSARVAWAESRPSVETIRATVVPVLLEILTTTDDEDLAEATMPALASFDQVGRNAEAILDVDLPIDVGDLLAAVDAEI